MTEQTELLAEGDLRGLRELKEAARATPWVALDGRVYVDNPAIEKPWEDSNTLLARFVGPNHVTNAQYAAQAATIVSQLADLAAQRLTDTQQARSDAARLADAIDETVASGVLPDEAEDALLAAVATWEQSLRDAGLNVANGPVLKAAGVLHDSTK